MRNPKSLVWRHEPCAVMAGGNTRSCFAAAICARFPLIELVRFTPAPRPI